MIIILKKESLEPRQMTFTLAHLEALEICLKEAEEKAKALSEQVIPIIGTGKIYSSVFSRASMCFNLYNYSHTYTQHYIHLDTTIITLIYMDLFSL